MNSLNYIKNFNFIGLFNKIVKYFSLLKVSYHISSSLLGFSIFLIIGNQLLSGLALSFSLICETMLITFSREEEDSENNYIDDFFWLHERGVDILFISVFLHLFRKLFINVFDIEQDFSWKSGSFAFLIIQLTVFAGLVLCCTHLSEITLVIAANVMHSFFFFIGKAYWWPFTDKYLNTDTIVRMAYLHYVVAFFLFYLGLNHGIDMHYDWKAKNIISGIKQQTNWWDEALSNELSKFIDFIVLLFLICEILYTEPEALSYEIFMWGDVGIINDVRFYGVAPHWYFRPYMAWLVACPFHYTGIFGVIYFFIIIYFQVSLHSNENNNYNFYNFILTKNYNKYQNNWSITNPELSLQWLISYSIFIICILYSLSFLPYGRFFNKIGGNTALLMSYFYIFSFLGFSFIRNSYLLNNYKSLLIN